MEATTPTTALEVRTRISLRWRDLDLLGHLNQSVYHELLEEGRGALLERLRGEESLAWVLARVELDYVHEIVREDGEVEVVTRVVAVGTSSITIEHEILAGAGGRLAAGGQSVMVAFDVQKRAARPFSATERRKLSMHSSRSIGAARSSGGPKARAPSSRVRGTGPSRRY